jgi:hypothetical protein
MKAIAVAFAALFLLQIASSALTCSKGYWDRATPGENKCVKCAQYMVDCSSTPTVVVSSVSGYFLNTTLNANIPYCATGYYNKVSTNCEQFCKIGCSTCIIDYDFCTDCTNGFVWNNDFTCIPAVVGLEAASLALLTLGLVFLIISCCLVNKARK